MNDARNTKRRKRAPALVAVIALVFVAFACGEVQPDEIECEEAVAHLKTCCPGLDPSGFNCVNQESCGETFHPSFSIQTSQCIRKDSCDALVSGGTCARAIEGNFLPDQARGAGSTFDEGLCP